MSAAFVIRIPLTFLKNLRVIWGFSAQKSGKVPFIADMLINFSGQKIQ